MCPTAWQRPSCYTSSSRSSTSPFSAPPSSTAIMSARSTSLPISCNISARSTWRSTCTLSASVSLSATFGFSASPPHCSSPTSSLRGYRRVYSTSFNSASTSVHDRVETIEVLEYPLRVLGLAPCNYSYIYPCIMGQTQQPESINTSHNPELGLGFPFSNYI
jgi:hypothetical protein